MYPVRLRLNVTAPPSATSAATDMDTTGSSSVMVTDRLDSVALANSLAPVAAWAMVDEPLAMSLSSDAATVMVCSVSQVTDVKVRLVGRNDRPVPDGVMVTSDDGSTVSATW